MMINFILSVVVLNIISVIGKSHIDFLDNSLRNTLKVSSRLFEDYGMLYCELSQEIDEETQKKYDEILKEINNIVYADDFVKRFNSEKYIMDFVKEKQWFFYKVYLEIIKQHKEGISTKELKSKSKDYILKKYGFDPFDPDISGYSKSQGVARSEQWASNVISNQLLDKCKEVRVVRNSKRDIWVYPVGV